MVSFYCLKKGRFFILRRTIGNYISNPPLKKASEISFVLTPSVKAVLNTQNQMGENKIKAVISPGENFLVIIKGIT